MIGLRGRAREAFEAWLREEWIKPTKGRYTTEDCFLAGYRAGVEAAAQLCVTDGALYTGIDCADAIIRELLPGTEGG